MITTIHLCTSCDNNYYTGLVGLIKSILQNSNKNKTILHILFTNISIHKRHLLQKLCCNTNLSLDFIDMLDFDIDTQFIDMQYWNKTIFYRLMIPKIFNGFQRILYLDADTLVLSDLTDLYNTDLQGNLLAMVSDRFSSVQRAKVLQIYRYFNSGMILFDIKQSTDFQFTEKCINWLYNNKSDIIYPDQDAISVICENKILRLLRQYNSQYDINDTYEYHKNTNPVIAHFLGKTKPWNGRSILWQFQLYKKYMFFWTRLYVKLIKYILYISKYFFHSSTENSIVDSNLYCIKKYYIFNICIIYKKRFIDHLQIKDKFIEHFITNTIHLCTSCDNNYYTGLVGLIKSILQNSNKNKTILHILFTNISIHKRHLLQKLCRNTNLSLDFIDMSNFDINVDLTHVPWFNKTIFYRLMIPKIFNGLQRILYLDADTLVLSDLTDLYNTDLQGNLLAMVSDRFSSNKRTLKLHINNYFNSGIILFNIPKTKAFNVDNQCVVWIETHHSTMPDQDAISVICENKILCLSRQYNSQYGINDTYEYHKNTNPVIAHFLGKTKPWNGRSILWQFQLYKKYMFFWTRLYIKLIKYILYISKYFFHSSTTDSIIDSNLYRIKRYYIFNICIIYKKRFIDHLQIKDKYVEYLNSIKNKDV